jgi:hypothetical protein
LGGAAGGIADLPRIVARLIQPERERIERLFDITSATGQLIAPALMHAWLTRQFGSLEAVESQRIVKVTNRWTLDTTLFNELRARRPVERRDGGVEQAVAASQDDDFCEVDTNTPADVFGRVRGASSTTAANVAKYEAWSSVIVFDEHHPLHLTEDSVADVFTTGLEWGRQVRKRDPDARYFFLMWNCLWRAGASVVHGHAQVSATRGSHYGQVERWRQAARRYPGGYFEDLFRAHESLGLAFDTGGVRALAHLTPIKERETLLIAPSCGPKLWRAVYGVLDLFIHQLGVASFNLALYVGPSSWRGFPAIVRIVDRGDPGSRTSDIGGMELFAAGVVAGDPFQLSQALRERLDR